MSADTDTQPGTVYLVGAGPGDPQTARVAADYLAGMTDRFALDEHHRLFDTYAPS